MTYRPPEPLGKQFRVNGFDCGEAALTEWLIRPARGAHAAGGARVLVSTLEDGETVVGNYALAAAQVAADATECARKG